MLREAIATGDTVEQAFETACRELGVESHEAQFDILEMPVKKKFGLFGGTPAKVRVYVKSSPADKAAEYLKDVLAHMGLTGVEVSVTEQEGGALLSLTGEDIGFVIGHRGDEGDVVLRQHGMGHRAHFHRGGIAAAVGGLLHYRHMLLGCTVGGVGDQLGHGLAAADHGYPLVHYFPDDIAAVGTTIELEFHLE